MRVLLCLAGLFAFAAAHTCPPLWTMGTEGCYRYFNQPKPFAEARAHCMGFTACGGSGVGDLAIIPNQAANDFMKLLRESSTLAGSGSVPSIWLGGTDDPIENNWRWTNGQPWGFVNWAQGQPNNQGGNQDCLRFPADRTVDQWDDWDCMTALPYVCQLFDDPKQNMQPGFGTPGTPGQRPAFMYGQPQQAQIGGRY